MGVAKKAKRDAKAVKGKTKKDVGKAKHKGKKVKRPRSIKDNGFSLSASSRAARAAAAPAGGTGPGNHRAM